MIKQIKLFILPMLLLLAAVSASAYSPLKYGIDPHDSLLFDADLFEPVGEILFFAEVGCFTRVTEVTGNVTGKVLKKEIIPACGENETLYTAEERQLKKGDKLLHGSDVITGPDGKAELTIVLMESTFHAVTINVGPGSQIKTPSFVVECKVRLKEKEQLPPEEIEVIKGTVTYDAPPEAEFKATTKGKRSSVKHTKTRFSHEVKFEGSDTLDIIRVYEGAVEVSMMSIDTDDANMTKNLGNLGEEMQSGKLSAEEIQAKMTEFQNYTRKINELMQPLNVDEGFKCTVTKNSRVIEPLGTGDEEMK